MLKLVLDRIEQDMAILIEEDTGDIIKCSSSFLPQKAKEGDVLKVFFELDDIATKNKNKIADMLLNDLLKED